MLSGLLVLCYRVDEGMQKVVRGLGRSTSTYVTIDKCSLR